jgi:hypothetical protein
MGLKPHRGFESLSLRQENGPLPRAIFLNRKEQTAGASFSSAIHSLFGGRSEGRVTLTPFKLRSKRHGPMSLTDQEALIQSEALEYARRHKKAIAKRLTDPARFPPEENPVSVFMAGSPGAGKTESSIELLNTFSDTPIIRIDPDDLRSEFKQYTGANAWLFQRAVSGLVDKIHDLVLQQKQSFLLDGTLSSYDVAQRNIKRSLEKKRTVQILYVYQEPHLAWEFVQAREAAEGRRIRVADFIEQYFAAREVVNGLKSRYGKDIQVDLLLKNIDNSQRSYRAGVDRIDNHIPEKYTRADLEQMFRID